MDSTTNAAARAGKTLDLADFDSIDQTEMNVVAGGQATGWMWTFAGPGHPNAAAQSNRVARESLAKARAKEQAQTNGRKWKAPEQSPDELLEDNVNFVLERLLDWSGDIPTVNGEPYQFSHENARKLLMDRRKGALLQQAIEFILDENSFTKRSARN
jgi:hypothetical protein